MTGLEHFLWLGAATFVNLAPLLALVFVALAIGTISFLASSLARNTLQTLGPAVLGIMASWGLILSFVTQSTWINSYHQLAWQGPLPFIIGIPLMSGVILWLAYRNFCQVRPQLRLIGANLATLVVAVLAVVVLTSAIYHRCWEKLTPFEPRHGAPQLARDGTTKFTIDYGEFLFTLPDGKRLTTGIAAAEGTDNPVSQMLGNQRMMLSDWHVVGGKNWWVLNYSARDVAGIKTDGTLWTAPRKNSRRTDPESDANGLVQFGSETNWSSLAGFSYCMLLTKTDGTLWLWEPDDRDYASRKKPWPGLAHFTPHRVGTDSDWAEVRQMGLKPWLKKKDSSFYSTDNWGEFAQQPLLIDSNLVVFPVPDTAAVQTPNMVTLYYIYSERLRVDPDGVFRIIAGQEYLPRPRGGNNGAWTWKPKDLPIGQETNWLAAVGEGHKAVTLKKDGTLWLWEFNHENYKNNPLLNLSESEIQKTVPMQLGTHSDWIAIAEFDSSSLIALAADGSLWYWPLSWTPYYYSDAPDQPLHFSSILDVSHKPQLLGNVFDTGS
jgi:hypothetical protein